jgi:hypothetical protein
LARHVLNDKTAISVFSRRLMIEDYSASGRAVSRSCPRS